MFPAAIAIVVQTFDLRSRGRALALFFGVAGGLTAIGPIAGGYLIEWTWRAIFWINIPVALIALVLIALSKPPNERHPAPIDYRGLALIVGGVGLSVFGFQQSALWGWGNPAIWVSIAAGVVLLVVFAAVERRTESPLINVRIFENRTFDVQNIVLGVASMAFIPVFFFASTYGQIALGQKATTSSLAILYFFIGFVVFAQIGGRMLDRAGAKRPVVLGCVIATIGFALWAGKVTDLNAGSQTLYIIIAGAGMGLMLGQSNTDAINRASRLLLRRGDRHHPDRAQLRRQPRLRHPRHDSHQPLPVRDHLLAHQPGSARTGRGGRGVEARPAPGRRQRQRRLDPAVHPGGLRQRDRGGAVRDGDHHGGRRPGRAARPQPRRPAGDPASRRGAAKTTSSPLYRQPD